MPKFKMPEGVEVPEGLMAGDRFQVVATVVMGDGGKAELVEVDGMPIPGYEGKGGKKKKGEMMEEEEYEGDGEESAVVAETGPRGGGFIEQVMARKMG